MDVDIDSITSDKIIDFCSYQMKYNIRGIGNECTHFVYAALFEAGAEDGVTQKHAKIQQDKVPYVWGRKLKAQEMGRGDVAQFLHHSQNIFVYSAVAGHFEHSMARGPIHTGIVYKNSLFGGFQQFESHLHQEGIARMTIRTNNVYNQSFGIVITSNDMNKANITSNSQYFVLAYMSACASDFKRLVNCEYWCDLRIAYGVDVKTADVIKGAIKKRKKPTYKGQDVAIFFEVKVSGDVTFYHPIVSDRRKNMTDVQKTVEKNALIKKMIASGRKGVLEKNDQYGGDVKSERVKLGAFSWNYPKK